MYCLELGICLKSQASDRTSGLQGLKVWLKINHPLFIHSSLLNRYTGAKTKAQNNSVLYLRPHQSSQREEVSLLSWAD